MITLKVALRNVLRQKRRTLLTVLTMMGGFTLASLSIAWSDGTYNTIIDMFTRNQLGHIQVHGMGYLDKPTLYNTIDDYTEVGESIEAVEGVEHWAPRIYAAGLASVVDKSAGVRIIGVDPLLETASTRLDKKVTRGRTLSQKGSREVLLGKGLAEVLHADPGDEFVILTQGADGSLANDLYSIVGIVEAADAISDQTTVYMSLVDAQELLVLYGRVHEIAVVVDDLDNVRDVSVALEETLGGRDLAVAPWQEFAREFYTAMKADQQGTWIMLFVIVLIVSVGVLNTVLMTVLERTREYGVLRAIGARPFQICRLVIYEVIIMAVGSVFVGFWIALILNYSLSHYGIEMPSAFTYGGIEFSAMYTEINTRSFVIPGITVLISAVVVSIFPAVKAARTSPAKAMRTH